MTEEQKAAYVNSQSICALIEAMGMTAENYQRVCRGESVAYIEADFVAMSGGWNPVVNLFSQSRGRQGSRALFVISHPLKTRRRSARRNGL